MRKIDPKIATIHNQFVTYGRNAREWMRKCEMLLPHIDHYKIWEKKGYKNIYHYASVLAGMNKAKVDSVLWTMKKIEDKKEILKVAEEKGLNAVRPIANMVNLENQSFWAEKAREMSMHTLEAYAKEYKKDIANEALKNHVMQETVWRGGSDEVDVKSCRATRKVVGMDLEIEIIEQLEKLKGKEDWNELMKKLLELHEEKLQSEKPETVKVTAGVDKPEAVLANHQYFSRNIPLRIKKYIINRTNGQCAFPGCKKEYKILHHTERFSLNKEHNPDTIVALCKSHERLVHKGFIANENEQPQNWKFQKNPNTLDPKFAVDQLVAKYINRQRN